jgi:long-chain acyl-CoA synthetase
MSECSPLMASNPAAGKKKLGSIGLPLLNTAVKLVDPTTGEEVSLGQPGEICVKGPQVMSGYYKKPDETKIAIDGDGYMHTGDVAIMDDEGYLRIVDRTKDMIIVSGFKVFSVKVEAVLAEHPAVDLAAIIGIPNPERPGSEIVQAFIQLSPGHAAGDREALKKDILAFAAGKLTPYEVPRLVEFMDALPLTAVGKLDKKALRRRG